ncbi:MAG TPA: hypothetical protein VFK05_08930 [Polyangiaceae bacterium]|nr:hypothetical protein [Polyangiaceae bacterium]
MERLTSEGARNDDERIKGEEHAEELSGALERPEGKRDPSAQHKTEAFIDCMLSRGWRLNSIQKAVGANFLRTLEALRG